MNQRPYLRIFVTPAALCAVGFSAALLAVMQYSLRAYVPGSLDPGGFTLANFTALMKPLYARVFFDTVWICFLTAFFTLIIGYPLAYALVHARNVALKSAILVITVTPLFLGEVVRTYSWIVVLGNNGFVVRRCALYRIEAAQGLPPESRSALQEGSLDAVMFFSPRTAAIFVRLAEGLPTEIRPMLAETDAAARSNPEWLYEPKLDGYRVITFVGDGSVRLQSRRGIDLTAVFPEITADLALKDNGQMVLDGEIVALDANGRPSFNALQNRVQLKTATDIAKAQREAPAVLVCFDLLHFGGVNLRGVPYVDRRRYLSQCLLPSTHIQLIHVATNAEQLYAAATASGFEGIVAKRKNSIYQPGKRSNAWLKIKTTQTAEFVVGGYTKGKGERESLGALLLGYWSGGKLHYAGHVGSGLTSAIIDELGQRMAALARKRSAFVDEVPLHRPTKWLEPQLVAEVTFMDWTPDGLLRAPVFIRLRDDIEPQDVVGGPEDGHAEAAGGPRKVPSRKASSQEAPATTAGPRKTGSRPIASLATPANEIDAIVKTATARTDENGMFAEIGNIRDRRKRVVQLNIHAAAGRIQHRLRNLPA